MMILWIVIIVGVALVVWTWVARSGPRGGPSSGDEAERIVGERFARGEIDEATYQRMLSEIRGGRRESR